MILQIKKGMGNDNQIIMAVPAKILFGKYYFEGFRTKGNYYSRILKNKLFARRGDLEVDYSMKQIIPYAIIINKNRIFTFQREDKIERYHEKRLYGKWSIGVGGHIDDSEKNSLDPIKEGLMRELNEEVKIEEDYNIKLFGYINNDEDSVGKVHFGVVFLIETNGEVVKHENEFKIGKFKTMDEIKNVNNFESWSSIVYPYVLNENQRKLAH